MKVWTRLISLILSLALLVQIVPARALAAVMANGDDVVALSSNAVEVIYREEAELQSDEDESNLEWSLVDGVLTISGTGDMTWGWDNWPWIDASDTITSVVVEEGVTSVSMHAFTGLYSLTDVTLADSITRIEGYAFDYSPSLERVKLPSNLKSIGDYAFSMCELLREIELPVGLETIGVCAFQCCDLREIIIPQGCLAVEASAFYQNKQASRLVLPDTLTTIGANAFSELAITEVTIPDSVVSMGAGSFAYCDLTSVVIPDSVTELGTYAFSGCTRLEEASVSRQITSLPESLFMGCTSLKRVTFSEKVDTIGTRAFSGCSSLEEFEIPEGTASIGAEAFRNCTSLTQITIPDGITSIAGSLFSGCSSLKNVTLPEGVELIAANAFENCTALESIVLPATMLTLYERAFAGSGLRSIDIPEGVYEIDEYCFNNCTQLETLKIPSSVSYITREAFAGCTSLTDVRLGHGVKGIGWNTFSGCSSLPEITIPGSVEYLYYRSFADCSALQNVVIQDGVQRLEGETFLNCTALERIEIPLTVSSIQDSTFSGCENVVIYTYPQSYAWTFAQEHGIPVAELETVTTDLTMYVRTPDGTLITEGYEVNWYELGDDTPIATGNVLFGADLEEHSYEAEILLGEELSYEYVQPGRVLAQDAQVDVTLEAIGSVTVSGTVTDQDGNILPGARIRFVQTYNDSYRKVAEAAADENGQFAVLLDAVPTSAEVSAENHFPRTVPLSLGLQSGSAEMGSISLTRLPGNRIKLSLQYQEAVPDGETAALQTLHPNALQLDIENVTRDQAVTEYTWVNSELVLSDAQAGPLERVCISFTDPSGKLASRSLTLTLDSNACAEGAVLLTEQGGFSIDGISGTTEAIMMLFDAGGLIRDTVCVNRAVGISNLPAGEYSAVFLQDNTLLRSASSLSALDALGLVEGTDYSLYPVTVEDGRITQLGTVIVPVLDEERLFYTVPEQTFFTTSSTSVYPGRYILLRLSYAIDPQYETSGQQIVLELPDQIRILESGIYLDDRQPDCTVRGNTVTIDADQPSGVLRFYVVGDSLGAFDIHGYLRFECGGTSVTQSVGTVRLDMEAGTISLPTRTAQTTVAVTGTTMPNSRVQLYVNDTLCATTASNGAGSWSLEVPLENHYSRASYEFYAVVTSDLLEKDFRTESCWLCYDADEVNPVTLTMYCALGGGTQSIVYYFDRVNKPQNILLPDLKYHPDFTFTVQMDAADPSTVKAVRILTVNGRSESGTIECVYDKEKNLWIGTAKYTNVLAVPVSLSVDYDVYDPERPNVIDAEQIEDIYELIAQADAEVDAMLAAVPEGDYSGFESMSVEELTQHIEMLSEEMAQSAAAFDYVLETAFAELDISGQEEDGQWISTVADSRTAVSVEGIETIDHDTMLADGYEAVPVSDGSYIYQRTSGAASAFADARSGLLVTSEVLDAAAAASDGGEAGAVFRRLREELSRILNKVQIQLALGSQIDACIDRSIGQLNAYMEKLEAIRKEQWEAWMQLDRRIDAMRSEGFTDEQLLDDLAAKQRAERLMLRANDYHQSAAAKLKNLNGWQSLSKMLKAGSLMIDILALMDQADKVEALLKGLENCPSAETEALKGDILALGGLMLGYVGTTLLFRIAGIEGIIAAALAGGPLCIATGLAALGVYIYLTHQITQTMIDLFEDRYYTLLLRASQLECFDPPKVGALNKTITFQVNTLVDPSGYVYEAVPSNRLEGVRAEVFYVDENGQEVSWNAEDFDQTNPLFTNAAGVYRWDVPFGLWLVKYSKEGYLDTDSRLDPAANADGYLPVPPPQMDVNVGMVSTAAPEVAEADAFENQIRIVFSQYMQPDSVRAAVVQDGQEIPGVLEPVNAEWNADNTAQYATVFRFIPDRSLSGNVELQIGEAVNYAGTGMAAAYTASLPVHIQPNGIHVRESVTLSYTDQYTLKVQIVPAEAGANRTVSAESAAPGIVDLVEHTVTANENGLAEFTLAGVLPGSGQITIRVDGTDVAASTDAIVTLDQPEACAEVSASIPSGEAVAPGTMLTLSTATEGASIYYTTDGTCPCVIGSPSRMAYTGPIEITEDTHLIAYAVKEGMADSPRTTFIYTTAEEETHAPFLSFRWLDNTGDGWFQQDGWMYDGNDWCNGYTGWGAVPGSELWQVYYLNTWNPDTQRYDAAPVRIQVSDNLVSERLCEGDHTFRADAADTDYYYRIAVDDDAWDQSGIISYTLDDGTQVSMECWLGRGEAGFYTDAVMSNDTCMTDQFRYERLTGKPQSFYFGFQSGYWTLDRVEPVIGHLDISGLTVEDLFTLEQVDQDVYKITLDPVVVSCGEDFEVGLRLWLTDPAGNSNNGEWYENKWCSNDWDNEQQKAEIRIDSETYRFFEAEGETLCFAERPADLYRENGDMVWMLERTGLPAGVSYDLTTNTLSLNGADLQLLGLCGMDRMLPGPDLTIDLAGRNSLSCDHDCPLVLDGVQAEFTGSGSLYVHAQNQENTNEYGNYSFDAIHMSNGSSMTLSDSVEVTAEISGSALEDCWEEDTLLGSRPATLWAIRGNRGSLTIRDSASLTTVIPADARENGPRVSEDEVIWDHWYPGGCVGIGDMGRIVIEGGSLNTQALNLSSSWNEQGEPEWTGSYIQTGGVVTIESQGSYGQTERWEWDEERQEDVFLGTVDHYHYGGLGNYEGGYIEISGGTLNITCNPTPEEISSSAYGCALYAGSQLNGEVVISGGTVNAEVSGGDAVHANMLHVSGGTLNAVSGSGNAIYAENSIRVSGGTVNAGSRDHWTLNLHDADMTITGGTVRINGRIVVGEWEADPNRPGYGDGTLTVSGGSLVQTPESEGEFCIMATGRAAFCDHAAVEMNNVWLNLNGELSIGGQADVDMTDVWVNAQSDTSILVDGGSWDICGTYDFRDEQNEWPTGFWSDHGSTFTINGGRVNMVFTDYRVGFGTNGDFTMNGGEMRVELVNEDAGFFLQEDGGIVTRNAIAFAGKGCTAINGGRLQLIGYTGLEHGVDGPNPEYDWPGNFDSRLMVSGGVIEMDVGFRGMEIWAPAQISGGVINVDLSGTRQPYSGYTIGQGIAMWNNGFEEQGAGSSLQISGGRVYLHSGSGDTTMIYGMSCTNAVITCSGGTILCDTTHAIQGAGAEDMPYLVMGDGVDIIDVENLAYKQVIRGRSDYSWTDENGEVHQEYNYGSTVEYDDVPGNLFTGENLDECARLLITDYGCAEALRWSLDNGTVTISGNGAMYDYDPDRGIYAPWYILKDFVTSIKLETGITHLGQACFRDCTGLGDLVLPASVESIGSEAFAGSDLTEIRFLADAPVFGTDVFAGIAVTACYPASNETWNADVMLDYGGETTWIPVDGSEMAVTYTQASISLAGDIGVNYYVHLSDDIAADADAYMQFTVAGQRQTVPLNEAVVSTDANGVTTYRFTCKVPAKQMTAQITGQMYLSDGTAVGEAKTYSVKAYCDAAIPVYSQYGAYADLVTLMKAMLNYGAYSQISLGYATDDLANAGLTEQERLLPETVDAGAYAHSVIGSEDGIMVYSASLLLESKTTIRFYFRLTGDKTIDQYEFLVNGTPRTPTTSGSLYYVDVPNVAAKDLDEMQTVTVGGMRVSYCGLSYVNQMMNWAGITEAGLNVVKALYVYNQAANAYFA